MPVARKKIKSAKLVPFSARRKHSTKRKASSAELEVYAMLKDEGISFRKEKAISRIHVDVFIAPRTVIEVQGCHWHKHDCLMPQSGWTPADQEIRSKDSNRFAFLRSEGYQVILIWECDLRENPMKVRRMIRELRS